MKNLFYVCLVAIISLGSTGFTTVEESVVLGNKQECTGKAIVMYDFVMCHPYATMEAASAAADAVYEDCMEE